MYSRGSDEPLTVPVLYSSKLTVRRVCRLGDRLVTSARLAIAATLSTGSSTSSADTA